MMVLDITNEISCSASDKSNIQKILLCVVTQNPCKKQDTFWHTSEKHSHQVLGCGFFTMLQDNTVCFHYHSLVYNCSDVHRTSEDEWKTYSHHLTQFPLAFRYSTLCPKKNSSSHLVYRQYRQFVTYYCDNKQSLSSTDPMCCDKRTFLFRSSELHQSENLLRKDTCKSSEICDSPCLNSGLGTQQDQPSCAF